MKDIKITDLIRFGEIGLQMFDKYLGDGKIKPPMRLYIQHSITDFEISEKVVG